jgi:acetylornithine deacetylase/succinyl-diaminopimelate desuccinylase-like protein
LHLVILPYTPRPRERYNKGVSNDGQPSDTGFASDLFLQTGLPALEEYVSIECLSPDFDPDWKANGHIDRAAQFLASWCKDQHVPDASIEIVRVGEKTPVLLAEIPATAGEEHRSSTLIYGHFDKQPPLGTWRDGLSAFTPVRIDDRLYGRGTADDGYATFAAFAAISSLAQRGIGHGRIVVLIEASEESGSPDLEAYLDEFADHIGTPGLVICLDSGCVSYDRLWVTNSLRGVVSGTLRVDVLTEGVHSGHASGIVPSSFRIARELLDRLEDSASGEIRIDALNSEIPAHRLAEIDAIAMAFGEDGAGAFPTVNGLRLDGGNAAERIVRGTWRPTLSVIGQEGMPDLGIGGNVLRPYTALKLSIRLPPNVDAQAATEAVIRTLTSNPPSGATVSFTPAHPAQGWDAPPHQPWLADAVSAASVAHFGAPPGSLGLGGSIPFMAALGTRFLATQFLATGVLGPGSNAHGPNEFLHLPTACAVACCVADVLAIVK